MSLQTTIKVTCDFTGCKDGQGRPNVVEYVKEECERDESKLPEAAKYMVLLTTQGQLKTFCCQLHAAEFFLPSGYEAKQKQVIEIRDPKKPAEPESKDRTVISRSEYSPENGQDGAPV